MTETTRVEYKEELTRELDIEKEVIAFLNYHEGGVMYIGIDKHGTVKGVADLDGDMLKIKDRLKDNIQPSCMGLFDVTTEEIGGVEVIKVLIASGPEKPYYKRKYGMSERGCYIRNGTAADPMPVKMIEELFSRRTRNSIGKINSPKQDLTFTQLKIYYEEKGIVLNDHFANNLELTTEDGAFNYVAYLMADKNNISFKVAKYSGTTRENLIESAEFGMESMVKATKRVLDKLEIENIVSTEITAKERSESRRWNAIAIREAVVNAFVHNDYSKEVSPKFEIFDDRIEITSAGGLPEGLNESEFFDGYSVPRNKEVIRIYKDLDLMEQLGSGVPRILGAYSRDCFTFSENFIRMSFPGVIPEKASTEQHSELSEKPELLPEIIDAFGPLEQALGRDSAINIEELRNYSAEFSAFWESSFGLTSGKLRESFGKVSGRIILTLELITIYPEITAAEIGEIINVSERSVQEYFKKLREAEIIEREGGRKEGEWIIKNHK